MTPLQESALIRLGLDREFMGWYLVRRLGAINGTWADLAVSLGLSTDQMVTLAWCKSPRDEFWGQDVRTVSEYVGIDVKVLQDLLMEEKLLDDAMTNR